MRRAFGIRGIRARPRYAKSFDPTTGSGQEDCTEPIECRPRHDRAAADHFYGLGADSRAGAAISVYRAKCCTRHTGQSRRTGRQLQQRSKTCTHACSNCLSGTPTQTYCIGGHSAACASCHHASSSAGGPSTAQASSAEQRTRRTHPANGDVHPGKSHHAFWR